MGVDAIVHPTSNTFYMGGEVGKRPRDTSKDEQGGKSEGLGCKGQSRGITVKGFSCCDEYVQKFRCHRDSPGVKGSEDWVYFAWFNKGQGNGSAQRSTEGERDQRTG